MKEYKFNKFYNIIVLKRKYRNKDIFEYYLERKGYGNLMFMFGIKEDLPPSCWNKRFFRDYIRDFEVEEFGNCGN